MHIVFVGLAGVGKMNRACDVRLSFFANLLAKNNKVSLLNRYASQFQLKSGNVELNDYIESVNIIEPRYTSGFLTKILFFLSVFVEFFYILKLNQKIKINVLHVYSGHFLDMMLYWITAKLIHAKVVYQYVEYKSVLPVSKYNLYAKINNYLVDYQGAKLWDGVIPISNFLQERALEVNPRLISQKVTPLCDFSEMDKVDTGIAPNTSYLLYCGSIGYEEVADMIVRAFENSSLSNKANLVMVLGGDKKKIEAFEVSHSNCTILTGLTYSDLITYYRHAMVLLIPLRDNIRDIARFPNKICEYLAAHGVIVTTNVGEMSHYFHNGKNAIVVPKYDEQELRLCFDKIANEEFDINAIRKKAYETGLKYFDTESYETAMNVFFNNLFP